MPRKRKQPEKVTIQRTLRLSASMDADLVAAADQQDRSVNWLIRHYIREGLKTAKTKR